MVHVLFKQQMRKKINEVCGVFTVSIETTTGTFLINYFNYLNIFPKITKRKINLRNFLSIVYNILWKYTDGIRMYLVNSSATGSKPYPFSFMNIHAKLHPL